jgi:hypothetical protein
MSDPFARAIFKDYLELEEHYMEWCKKSVPPAKVTVQSFLVYLAKCDLINDTSIHIFLRNLREGTNDDIRPWENKGGG